MSFPPLVHDKDIIDGETGDDLHSFAFQLSSFLHVAWEVGLGEGRREEVIIIRDGLDGARREGEGRIMNKIF